MSVALTAMYAVCVCFMHGAYVLLVRLGLAESSLAANPATDADIIATAAGQLSAQKTVLNYLVCCHAQC